jgi:hypothetical protein
MLLPAVAEQSLLKADPVIDPSSDKAAIVEQLGFQIQAQPS